MCLKEALQFGCSSSEIEAEKRFAKTCDMFSQLLDPEDRELMDAVVMWVGLLRAGDFFEGGTLDDLRSQYCEDRWQRIENLGEELILYNLFSGKELRKIYKRLSRA